MSYEKKVIWITGASSGIGAALALEASQRGAAVILSGRKIDALTAVASALVGDHLILPFDVIDYDNLSKYAEKAWTWKGRIDVLVNNAGISQRSLAVHTQPDVYTDLINVDLIAPIWLTQLTLKYMVAAKTGHIVAISSVAGRIGAPLRTAYSAAKHGLIGYMDSLRAEVEIPHNISVTNILPGSVATNVAKNALTADGTRRGYSDETIDAGADPADCAIHILDAVANNVREYIYAGELERGFAELRHSDPEKLFDLVGQLGAKIVSDYESGNDR